jgi:hypothetical protein
MPRSAPIASAVRIVSAPARADRNHDHFRRLARFLEAKRLFDGDLVEGIHRHLHVGQLDARTVAFNADLHVVVDHSLHWHKYLHKGVTDCGEMRYDADPPARR